jgi:hypothetical protein
MTLGSATDPLAHMNAPIVYVNTYAEFSRTDGPVVDRYGLRWLIGYERDA